MFLFKYSLQKIRFEVNPYYEEIHNINKVAILFEIVPSVEYSTDFNSDMLVLTIKASFIDADDSIEIIGYEGIAKAVLSLSNRKDDKKELVIWLKYLLVVLKSYWTNVCPLPYISTKLKLNVQTESDKILDFLEAKRLYK